MASSVMRRRGRFLPKGHRPEERPAPAPKAQPNGNGNGHAAMVGAVEFAIRDAEGSPVPIAWISNLSDSDRMALTETGMNGQPSMGIWHLGRRAVISGQDLSSRAKRFRHARLVRWIDPFRVKPR